MNQTTDFLEFVTIEKARLDALKAENARLRAERDKAVEDCNYNAAKGKELEARIANLVQALEQSVVNHTILRDFADAIWKAAGKGGNWNTLGDVEEAVKAKGGEK